jgi:holo-[acyl-carrier protein] synthase
MAGVAADGGGGFVNPAGVVVMGHGVDLADVARIDRMLQEHPERFTERVFTALERGYADAGGTRRAERYAARFAAKEAAMKALGTGWRSGIAWTDVEVVHGADGAPTLRVHGRLAEIAAERGVDAWLISLSHTDDLAMASVIAGRRGSAGPGSMR